MSNGGSMSIGSSGFFGKSSCAASVAAKPMANGNAIQRIIA
jgi:hypothetical protein